MQYFVIFLDFEQQQARLSDALFALGKFYRKGVFFHTHSFAPNDPAKVVLSSDQMRRIRIKFCSGQPGTSIILIPSPARPSPEPSFTSWRLPKWLSGTAEVSIAMPEGKYPLSSAPTPPCLVFLAWQRNNRSTIQGFHLYSDKGYLGNLVLAISHYGESYEAEIKFCSQ